MIIRLLSLFFLILLSITASAASLDSCKVQTDSDKTSLICMLNGSVTYKTFSLDKPFRAVIDFSQTTTHLDVNGIALNDGLITGIRRGIPNPNTLRLVLELKESARIKVTRWTLPNSTQNGIRIDLLFKKPMLVPVNKASVEPPMHNGHKKPVQIKHGPPKSLRDVVIVLDPGHGGKDPGASGPKHVLEKNVVLGIALKLKQYIDRQPGMHAVLTRQGDYYVGLRQRLNIARRHNADIFISIHADAFINHNSSGASVFALSPRGATSEAARWLAEKENYSELGGVNLSGLDDRSGVIRTVLLDLSQTATINASLQMGTQLLHHLDKVTHLHNNAVEQARFVVLKSPDIPSVLVETGFITNPIEEQNLSNAHYQARLTQAIFDGLKRYFWEHPPQGTRLETLSAGNVHVAKISPIFNRSRSRV